MEKLHINKLKIDLCYKIFSSFLLLLALVSVCILAFSDKESKLRGDEDYLIGRIESVEEDVDWLKIVIRLENKELVQGTYFGSEYTDVEYQDRVLVKGSLSPISSFNNFYCFSYEDYSRRKGLFYSMKIDSIDVLGKSYNPLVVVKNYIVRNIEGRKYAPYFAAFLLGDVKKLDKNVMESYRDNGISHLFAVSGMHLSFLIYGLSHFFRGKDLFKGGYFFLLVFVLFFYVFLVGFTPSVLRAFLFLVLLQFQKKFFPKVRSVWALLQTFSILLLWRPYFLFEIGFQYSFAVSFALVISHKFLEAKKNYFVSLFYVSLLAFLVSLPITIYHFHQINLLSVIYNLIFVPFVSFCFFPFTIISFLFSFFDPIYGVLVLVLEKTSLFLNKISLFKWVMPHPSIGMLIFILFLVVILFFQLRRHLLSSCFVLFIFLSFYTRLAYIFPRDSFTMLDVGQGDALLLQSKGEVMLIDTGGGFSSSGVLDYVIIPYLRASGIKRIDTLMLTHGDIDHLGVASLLLEKFPVEQVIFNGNSYNKNEKKIVKVLMDENISFKRDDQGSYRNGEFQLISLNKKIGEDENKASIVLFGKIYDFYFLLTGDAPILVEEELLDEYKFPNIDFLKVGHHGSDTSSSKNFIDAIRPKNALISVGKNNRYDHPRDEVLDNLKDSFIYRTDLEGSVEINFNKNNYSIRTVRTRDN